LNFIKNDDTFSFVKLGGIKSRDLDEE